MRAYVFENADPTGRRFIFGYHPDHALRLAWVEEGERAGRSDETICEELFAKLNRDDRPNGKIAPSMSVGDVVTFDDEEGTRSYSVAGMGFERLAMARVPSPGAVERWGDDLAEATVSGEIVRSEGGNEAVMA